jgi:hypothetical protein
LPGKVEDRIRRQRYDKAEGWNMTTSSYLSVYSVNS